MSSVSAPLHLLHLVGTAADRSVTQFGIRLMYAPEEYEEIIRIYGAACGSALRKGAISAGHSFSRWKGNRKQDL